MVDPTKQPGLRVEQIFLVESQFSHREDFLALPSDTKPAEAGIEVSLRLLGEPSGRGAGLSLRVESNNDSTALYRFVVEMMALVAAEPGQENIPPAQYVMEAGATLLFPFIRETLANLSMRGRFGPIWLKPFNVRIAIQQLTRDSENRKDLGRAAKTKSSARAKRSGH